MHSPSKIFSSPSADFYGGTWAPIAGPLLVTLICACAAATIDAANIATHIVFRIISKLPWT